MFLFLEFFKKISIRNLLCDDLILIICYQFFKFITLSQSALLSGNQVITSIGLQNSVVTLCIVKFMTTCNARNFHNKKRLWCHLHSFVSARCYRSGIEEDRVWSPEERRTYHFLGLTIHHQSQVFVIDLSDTTQPVWFLMRGTLRNDVTWETLSKALLKFRQDNFLRIKSNLFSELRVYLLQIW